MDEGFSTAIRFLFQETSGRKLESSKPIYIIEYSPMTGQGQHHTKSNLAHAHTDEHCKVREQDDEVSLKEIILKIREWWGFLLSKWKIILMAGFMGGIFGLTYAVFKKPIYTATTTFVLEEGESRGALGQYAGLASMVGVDLGGGGGGVFQGDNILELYKSRRMIQQTFLSQDTFDGKQKLLIDRYIEFKGLRKGWQKKQDMKNISFDIPVSGWSLKHDSLLAIFVNDINKNYLSVAKPDRKLSIIEVEVKSEDEQFAKAFSDNIVATVNDFYTKTKTKKSAENLAILQHQADSVKAVLNNSISGVAAAVDANPNTNPAFQRLRVPSQRKQVDVQASGAIYQEIVKNLEMAKISLRNEKPLIQVIDEPRLPLQKEQTDKLIALLIGSFIGAILILFLLVINRILKLTLKENEC